jgi:hypothetical protein
LPTADRAAPVAGPGPSGKKRICESSPITRIHFYIIMKTPAQIENGSFFDEPNLGTASSSSPSNETFLLAARDVVAFDRQSSTVPAGAF